MNLHVLQVWSILKGMYVVYFYRNRHKEMDLSCFYLKNTEEAKKSIIQFLFNVLKLHETVLKVWLPSYCKQVHTLAYSIIFNKFIILTDYSLKIKQLIWTIFITQVIQQHGNYTHHPKHICGMQAACQLRTPSMEEICKYQKFCVMFYST